MKLKLNRDQKRLPFGGHHYPTHGLMFKAETFDELEERLKNFRLANGMPIGQPDQDILLFYSKHWPWMVKDDRDATDSKESSDYVAWRAWVTATWNHPPKKLITSKEASDRWNVCEKCPFNRKMDWPETRESSETSRRAYVLRRGLPVPENLGYCALHHADLSVFTLTDKPTDFSTKKDGENPACWV